MDFAVKANAVEVGICLANGNPDRVVEIGDSTVVVHQEPAPDRRADLGDPNTHVLDPEA